MNGISAISHSPIRCPDWLAIRTQTDETAAASLTAILRSLDGVEKQVFALRGMAMMIVEERQLYRWIIDDEVGDHYQSFDRWMKNELPNSWGYCRDALRAVKELKDMPFEELLQIKRCNLEQLKKVSSHVRLLPEVVRAAKLLPEKEFVSQLNADHDQHLEVKKPIIMAPCEDCEELEQAINMAMGLEQATTRAEALKCLAISYLQDNMAAWERLQAAG